jgi:RNA polymerase sigma-70 factor, ECF subfamily
LSIRLEWRAAIRFNPVWDRSFTPAKRRDELAVSATAGERSIVDELEQAREGDAEVLGRALESCRDYLLLVAARGLDTDLVPKGGASDLVQETLLGACRDFGAFRGHTRDELLAWLRKILQNNLAVFRRRYRGTRKRRVALEVPIGAAGDGEDRDPLPRDSVTPGTHAARKEQATALMVGLGRLPEDYQQVVVWYQYDRLTFEEIGRRMGRSADAARKLWSRALIRLTEELGPAHDPRG